MVRLVCIGGGTGLPVLLSGLKELANTGSASSDTQFTVTAIVTVADSGGSTGMLRDVYRMPAVGDIRNCLVALSAGKSPLAEVSQYRFSGGGSLDGHALGNLLLTALYQSTGGLGSAIEVAREMFQSWGTVVPASEDEAHLCGQYDDGTIVRSQADFQRAGHRVERVWLEPAGIAASADAVSAIVSADAIVLSPGSLYSSVIATLLVPGIAGAINASNALTVYTCNLMTQPGETDGFTAADHVRALQRYMAPRTIDLIIANSRPVQNGPQHRYQSAGSAPVFVDESEISGLGPIPICADVLGRNSSPIRHEPRRLARLLLDLIRGAMRARDIKCESDLRSEW